MQTDQERRDIATEVYRAIKQHGDEIQIPDDATETDRTSLAVTRRFVDACDSEEEFVDYYLSGEAPAFKISAQEMAILSGGGVLDDLGEATGRAIGNAWNWVKSKFD